MAAKGNQLWRCDRHAATCTFISSEVPASNPCRFDLLAVGTQATQRHSESDSGKTVTTLQTERHRRLLCPDVRGGSRPRREPPRFQWLGLAVMTGSVSGSYHHRQGHAADGHRRGTEQPLPAESLRTDTDNRVQSRR